MINWDSGGKYKDDFTAKEGNYMLRCEQLDLRQWWFCCYHKGEAIKEGTLPYKEEAKEAAENAYREHKSKMIRL